MTIEQQIRLEILAENPAFDESAIGGEIAMRMNRRNRNQARCQQTINARGDEFSACIRRIEFVEDCVKAAGRALTHRSYNVAEMIVGLSCDELSTAEELQAITARVLSLALQAVKTNKRYAREFVIIQTNYRVYAFGALTD